MEKMAFVLAATLKCMHFSKVRDTLRSCTSSYKNGEKPRGKKETN